MSDEPNAPIEPKKDGRGLHPNSLKNLHSRWVKGQSGNPHGLRKEWLRVRELARQWTVQSVQTLAEIMLDKKEPSRSRVAAASELLDRGWGKPAQVIEGEGEQLIVTVRTTSGAEPWIAPEERKVQ